MRTGRRTRGPDGPSRKRTPRPASLSRYDVVLALLPLAVLVPAVASDLLGIPLRTALAAGSLLGVGALADALFLNPPTEGGPTN